MSLSKHAERICRGASLVAGRPLIKIAYAALTLVACRATG
jgi:hypothetical protein